MEVVGNQTHHRYCGYYDENAVFVRAIVDGTPSPCAIGDALLSMCLAERLTAALQCIDRGEPQ